MSTFDKLAKQGIYYRPLEAAQPQQDEQGDFSRGVEKAMLQVPQTAGGAAALVGDMVGSDGLRDYGMGIYQRNADKIEAITKPSDSLSTVLEGDGNAVDWFQNAAGYTTGQAAQALLTGGAGGFIGKQLAARGVGAMVGRQVAAKAAERAAEREVAEGLAERAAARFVAPAAAAAGQKGAYVGAGAALAGNNLVQEAGSIYPEAVEQARQDGRNGELSADDLARVAGASVAAAAVDTGMDALMAGRLMHGGRRALTDGAGQVVRDAAGKPVIESLGRAARREIPGMAAKEAATEGVQTGIERWGAQQDLSTADAIRDYVDSMGVGAVGGGLGGSASILRAQKVPESGSLTRAANAGIDNQILQLQYDPQPLISFPDGSVGHKQDLEAYLTQFEPEERVRKRREIMGRDPETGKRPAPEPEAPAVSSEEAEAMNLNAWGARHDPVTLDYAQALINTPAAAAYKDQNLMIVPHPAGKGYTVVPSRWLTMDTQARLGALQRGEEGMLPAPGREAPGGAIRVDGDGGAAPETYGDQVRTGQRQRAEQAALETAAQRAQDLGVATPHGTKTARALENEQAEAEAAARLPRLPAPSMASPSGKLRVAADGTAAQETYGEQVATAQRQRADQAAAEAEAQRRRELGTPAPRGASVEPAAPAAPAATQEAAPAPAQLATIYTGSGNPFKSEFAAKRRLKDHADTHQLAKVEGGWALEPKQDRQATPAEVQRDQIDTAAHQAATSPSNDLAEPTQAQKDAGNYQKGHVRVHGLDIAIENPAGSVRRGVAPDGKAWENQLQHHYGYIKRTEGADGDHVDTFVGPNPASDKVFVVNQVDPATGKFDEHKVVLGADSLEQAREIYRANYAKNWRGGRSVQETDVAGFKNWLQHGDTTKPYGKLNHMDEATAKHQRQDELVRKAAAAIEARRAKKAALEQAQSETEVGESASDAGKTATEPGKSASPAESGQSAIQNQNEEIDRQAASWGYPAGAFDDNTFGNGLKRPRFDDVQKIEIYNGPGKLPHTISLAQGPNGKWGHGMDIYGAAYGPGKKGIHDLLQPDGRTQYDTKQAAANAALSRIKAHDEEIHGKMAEEVRQAMHPLMEGLKSIAVGEHTAEPMLVEANGKAKVKWRHLRAAKMYDSERQARAGLKEADERTRLHQISQATIEATPKVHDYDASKARPLLLIACADGKLEGEHKAIDLYQGVMYDVLRKWMPDNNKPDVYIISAKYGVIPGNKVISSYDQKMTPERQVELLKQGINLDDFKGKNFSGVFVAGGDLYREVGGLAQAQLRRAGFMPVSAKSDYTNGAIGLHRSQLGKFLRGLDPDAKPDEAEAPAAAPAPESKPAAVVTRGESGQAIIDHARLSFTHSGDSEIELSQKLIDRVQEALRTRPDSYKVSRYMKADDVRITLPRQDGDRGSDGGQFVVRDNGKVSLLGDNGFGWGSTMSKASATASLTRWLDNMPPAPKQSDSPAAAPVEVIPPPARVPGGRPVRAVYTVKQGDAVLGQFRMYGARIEYAQPTGKPHPEVVKAAEKLSAQKKAEQQDESDAAERDYQARQAATPKEEAPAVPLLTGEALAEKAAAHWEQLSSSGRFSALLMQGMNDRDAEGGKLTNWDQLDRALQAKMAEWFAKRENWTADPATDPDGPKGRKKPDQAPPAAEHIENGKAEPATPAVIAASLEKDAAARPDIDYKTAKAQLLEQIDGHLVELKAQWAPVDKLDGKDYVAAAKALRERLPSHVTIDVPGDGKFNVANEIDKLQDFRKRAVASKGFDPLPKPRTARADKNMGISSGTDATIKGMLADGEKTGAYELAKLAGKPFRFSRNAKDGGVNLYTEARQIDDMPHGVKGYVGKLEGVKSRPWAFIEESTGSTMGNGSFTADAKSAEAFARAKLEEVGAEKIKEAMAKAEKIDQSALEQEWLDQAEAEENRRAGIDQAIDQVRVDSNPDAEALAAPEPAEAPTAPAAKEATAEDADPAGIVREIAQAQPFAAYDAVRDAALAAVKDRTGKAWSAHSEARGSMMRDPLAEAIHAGQYAGMQASAAGLPVRISEDAIPADLANRAYAGTSFSPEQRGTSVRRSYFREVMGLWRRFESTYNAAPAERQAAFVEAFNEAADRYAGMTNAYLSSHSRVASSMIAGPARFPTESNRKKSEAASRRAQEASEYLGKAAKRLDKVLRGPVDNSLGAALQDAEAKLAERERAQETWKAINAAIRKGDDAKLAELNLTAARIAELKKPDFAGRIGIPDYQLKNNNAEIRRMRERVAELQRRIATAGQDEVEQQAGADPVEAAPGVRMVQNAEANRLQLFFDGKPEEATREALKGAGFRWAPSVGAWQRQLTDNALAAAERVLAPMRTGQDGQLRAAVGRVDTPAFRRWFGESKVVDDQGRPLVVYHGTRRDFSEFKEGAADGGNGAMPGFFFGDEKSLGYIDGLMNSQYDETNPAQGGPAVMPSYLSIHNPKRLETAETGYWADPDFEREQIALAKREGHDGLVINDDEQQTTFYVAFKPEQIKSATGNRGTFDPADPDLRASTFYADKTVQVDGQRRPIVDSRGDLIAPDFAGQVAFWREFDGEVDEIGRPIIGDDMRAALGIEGSAMDSQVAGMVREGASADDILQAIAERSSNPDFRALASALREQQLKTGIVYGRPNGTYAGGVDASMATASYRQSTDTAFLHQTAGAEQNVLHELTHAATLRALQRGGLAAIQIRQLHAQVKDLPNFAGEYGITDAEEFVAEAFTSPQFRQLLADTPAPGSKLSIWQRLVGFVRILLRLPATSNNMLERVMQVGADLMAENHARGPAEARAVPAAVVSVQRQLDLDGAGDQLRASTASRMSSIMGRIGMQQSMADRVGDLFASEKSFNGWWHKTVGTQYHKAQINPHFGRVYNAVQRYLSGVSALANEAADRAPTLLPKLEGMADLKKAPPKREDVKAAAAAIFQGTLVDEQVYSDAELQSKFQLTPAQITLYREFRAATDKSLDDMGKTDLIRTAGKPYTGLRDQAMGAGDVGKAAELLASAAERQGDNGLAESLREKGARYESLKAQGYAPLSRFGDHTVYVTGENGEQHYFGLYESAADAAKAARDMTEIYPGATVTKGIMSKEGSRLFAGISPDTIELFSQVTGIDQDPLFQDYLKLVVNNRSALKRLIHRKGIAGYSEDVTRVLANFLTSNARAGSKNLHAGEMNEAAEAVPKGQGDVRDEAIRLVDYIQNPVEEAAKVRGLLFANFIGGSIASAMVNMTQPIMMTMPYLAQYAGAGKATKLLTSAMAQAVRADSTIADEELRTALQVAEHQGVVSPQEIHNLQAEAMRSSTGLSIAGKEIIPAFAARKLALVWGGFFGLAEQFNRKATFIAAYQVARDMTGAQLAAAKVSTPYEFAAKAIAETQGVYNRGNRANWGRGAVGATLMTFKQYSVSYLEFLKRLPPQQRALALAVLVVAAGANGIPFADDLDDVIDTIAQALGYNWQAKKARDRFLTKTLGRGGADFVQHGISGVSGVPLDLSMRMGMQNLLPATGIFLKQNSDKSAQIGEIGGAAGALATRVFKSADAALHGDVGAAASALSPTAIVNLAKGIDMLQTGVYRDGRGRKVVDADGLDAVVKMIGFQPSKVAMEQDKLGMARDTIAVSKAVETQIADEWARGVYEKDPQAVSKAREAISEWNTKNPDSRIQIGMSQVLKRVKEMRTAKADRVVRTAPKGMRAELREELKN